MSLASSIERADPTKSPKADSFIRVCHVGFVEDKIVVAGGRGRGERDLDSIEELTLAQLSAWTPGARRTNV